MPGHANTLSVTMAKPISAAELQPDHGDDRDQDVAQHVHADHAPVGQALRARELHVVLQQRLVRAGAREADEQRQVEERQVGRRHARRCLRPSTVRNDTGMTPKSSVVSPRPFDGSQPSITENTMISIRPTQNVGSEKPRIEPAMIERPAMPFGLQSRPQPERDAEHDRDQHRRQRELHRRRHPLEDEPERGRAVHERAAEIAVQRRRSRKLQYCAHSGLSRPSAAIARSRSIWSACGLIRMSIGLPIA